jgi:uncharacterized membrane protein
MTKKERQKKRKKEIVAAIGYISYKISAFTFILSLILAYMSSRNFDYIEPCLIVFVISGIFFLITWSCVLHYLPFNELDDD